MHRANFLRDIREGMRVFDKTNTEIGTVEWVKFGDDNPTTPEPEAADISAIERQRGDAVAFDPDQIPEEVREKLLLQGFVRIDAAGLLNADRYVMPEQIERITGDALVLNVSKSELLKER